MLYLEDAFLHLKSCNRCMILPSNGGVSIFKVLLQKIFLLEKYNIQIWRENGVLLLQNQSTHSKTTVNVNYHICIIFVLTVSRRRLKMKY